MSRKIEKVNREDLVAEYLAVTRTHGNAGNDSRSIFAKIYGAHYAALAKVLEPTLVAPRLLVVYTLQRQVELVSIKGELFHHASANETASLESGLLREMRGGAAGEPSLDEVLSMTGFLRA
jgi:hypothetical protein